MDIETAHRLVRATSDFYRTEAKSFSATRERPWEGWRKVALAVEDAIEKAAEGPAANPSDRCEAFRRLPFRMLDVGCGNLRFERFLAEALPDAGFEALAVDGCMELPREGEAAPGVGVSAVELDVMRSLELGSLKTDVGEGPFDLSAAFGFAHHVPMPQWRRALLETLVEATAPGGLVAVSFWQFENDEKMARKAEAATRRGSRELGVSLDEGAGDHLLGWKDDEHAFRYCHSFSDAEVDEAEALMRGLGAETVARYAADGTRSGSRNVYVMSRRTAP